MPASGRDAAKMERAGLCTRRRSSGRNTRYSENGAGRREEPPTDNAAYRSGFDIRPPGLLVVRAVVLTRLRGSRIKTMPFGRLQHSVPSFPTPFDPPVYD